MAKMSKNLRLKIYYSRLEKYFKARDFTEFYKVKKCYLADINLNDKDIHYLNITYDNFFDIMRLKNFCEV